MHNDWNAEAIAMARHVCDHMFEAHRGAMPWKQSGVTVIFGNDDHKDKRTQTEIARLRDFLELRGIPILGFGVEPEEHYSWAMLIQHPTHEEMAPVVWDCWNGTRDTSSFTLYQSNIAASTIEQHGTKPETSAN
jgi:hypothetical protein